MGGLLVAEWSKCPSGHPLALSLRTDLPVLVEDIVCEWCKAAAGVMRMHGKQYGDDASAFSDGRFYVSRPKLNGGRHG
jgi:hypothetical protein